MAVERGAAQTDDSRLRVPAALALHTQRSKPSWRLSTLMCGAWGDNALKTSLETGVSIWWSEILKKEIVGVLYSPHAISVTFAPNSSTTRRGRSWSVKELCPSCPNCPEPNVNTAPSWGSSQRATVQSPAVYLTYTQCFSLVHLPSTNMEEARFMKSTAASHQGVIKMTWLHFFLELSCRPSL